MLSQVTYSSDSSFTTVEHTLDEDQQLSLHDTTSTMDTQRTANTVAAASSDISNASSNSNSTHGDSGQWGFISNPGVIPTAPDQHQGQLSLQGQDGQSQDQLRDPRLPDTVIDVQIVNKASFLTEDDDEEEEQDSILRRGQLIVEGEDIDADDASSDISIDLSMPDTESIPTDLPTLSLDDGRDCDEEEQGTGDQDDNLHVDKQKDSASRGIRKNSPKHELRQLRRTQGRNASNNNTTSGSGSGLINHLNKTQRLWALLVGILSTIALGLAAVNCHQNHVREVERLHFEHEIQRLRSITEHVKEESQKKQDDLSTFLITAITGYARRNRQWASDKLDFQNTITNLQLVQQSLEDEVKQQEQLRLEEERKRKDLEEQAKWNDAFAMDVASRGLTIVDNCWLKAHADVQLGSCAEDALQDVKQRIAAVKSLFRSALPGMAEGVGDVTPAIAASADPSTYQPSEYSIDDAAAEEERCMAECRECPCPEDNGGDVSQACSCDYAYDFDCIDECMIASAAATSLQGDILAEDLDNGVPVNVTANASHWSETWGFSNIRWNDNMCQFLKRHQHQQNASSSRWKLHALCQGSENAEPDAVDDAENTGSGDANNDTDAESKSEDEDNTTDSDSPRFYDKAEKALDEIKAATEQSLKKITESTKGVIKDAAATAEASRRSLQTVAEAVSVASSATSNLKEVIKQAGDDVSVQMRSFIGDPIAYLESVTAKSKP